MNPKGGNFLTPARMTKAEKVHGTVETILKNMNRKFWKDRATAIQAEKSRRKAYREKCSVCGLEMKCKSQRQLELGMKTHFSMKHTEITREQQQASDKHVAEQSAA